MVVLLTVASSCPLSLIEMAASWYRSGFSRKPATNAESSIGLYSAHDGEAQMITVPVDAEAFQDAGQVKQYYSEGEGRSLLIAAPVEI